MHIRGMLVNTAYQMDNGLEKLTDKETQLLRAAGIYIATPASRYMEHFFISVAFAARLRTCPSPYSITDTNRTKPKIKPKSEHSRDERRRKSKNENKRPVINCQNIPCEWTHVETHASALGIRQSRWTVKFSAVAFRSYAVYLSESTNIKRTGFVGARRAANDI